MEDFQTDNFKHPLASCTEEEVRKKKLKIEKLNIITLFF